MADYVSFVLAVATLGFCAALGWPLYRLGQAVQHTGQRIRELADETARHERAVSRCVEGLHAVKGTAPARRSTK